MCHCWQPEPCGVKNLMQTLKERKSLNNNLCLLFSLHFHTIFGPWHWMAVLVLVLVSIVPVQAEKILVWGRPNVRVFKVGWFLGLSGAQGTMTTSLNEWSHSGHVTQRAYCMTGSTPPQIQEKNSTLSLWGGFHITHSSAVNILIVVDI